MRLIELRPADALAALAAEEAVLEAVDAGSGEPAWLFWTAPRLSAVLGTARPVERDLCTAAVRADRLPVLRRRSGGGTVLLGAASPAVTTVLPAATDLGEAYARFCGVLLAALGRLGVPAGFQRPADLAAAGRKLAGLAQRRRRAAELVTAAVLAAPLVEESGRYLAEPAAEDAPAYRAGRGHREFMTSLAELGVEHPAEALFTALAAELAERGASRGGLTADESRRAEQIASELADPAWIYRF